MTEPFDPTIWSNEEENLTRQREVAQAIEKRIDAEARARGWPPKADETVELWRRAKRRGTA